MIIFFVFAFLLLPTIHCSSDDHSPLAKNFTRNLYAAIINDARHEYSIGLQIANMQEIRYDIELEQEAKTFLKCEDIKHTSNYRVFFLEKRLQTQFLSEPDARLIMRNKTKLLENEDFKKNAEFLHPLQAGVGCVDLLSKCPFPGKQLLNEAGVVCLFGPKNTDPISEFKYGKPRSQCANGKADSGLCRRPFTYN
ncbi:hypothetical protein GCK72_012732 [Caenorhabditis remanei]|uniref:Uncharacterized protein n=1 Tax=Caenorhabditis remanei TaxID=31234 RepID=A0A6A5GP70_CAERE|nr:hypothetical protein GCK72_012732 [Caenorhabditis remanei]KAF1756279.1 hypothetical protein GCK72_012732 [Caenorhabditis remanei]